MEQRKKSLSGIQSTNTPHLGNYLGALRNWIKMQEEYDCAYFIADLHAITVKQDAVKFRQQNYQSFALLMALGVDTDKSVLFIQSHVTTHSELAWILSCFTPYGELTRMTQFKDKSQSHSDNINSGLLTYPILQAADILLYQADFVPVGADQKQHLELARNIAVRFNNLAGNTFTVPEPYIPKSTGRIMSLADPTKKMSKSDENPNGLISILDERDVIIRKFKRAVTDSEAVVAYREGKDGINNLISIYSAITGKAYDEIEKEFDGKGYGDFKMAVGEIVADFLDPVQKKYEALISQKDYLNQCMALGAEKAYKISKKTLTKAQKKLGLIVT